MRKKRKRLAVLAGQADESFQSRFISGFERQAFAEGKDVCVFSMYKKYQDTAEREKGESNIFSVLNPGLFDGIVILKDSIQTAGVAEEIEKKLKDNYTGPVLVVDIDSKYFRTVFIDCYTPVRELTDHLIEDHGLKDIAFLTGKKRHRHSKQRLAAFMESMKNHKLEVPKDRIIEGDFWYLSGEQCVDNLMSSGKILPEAIVCANDPMAIGVCKAFEKRGVSVPEEVIVVGCDSSMEGQTSPKILTSYVAPAYEMGSYAVGALEDIRLGRNLREFTDKARLIYGETCGCDKMRDSGYNIRRTEWDTEISSEGFDSVNNTMFENMMIHNDVMDFIGTVYSYAYQIKGAESFHLCLVDGIQKLGMGEPPINEGYSDKMIYAVKYNRERKGDSVGLETYFDLSEMLPGLTDYREDPSAFFFTPVFFEEKCFGYAVVSYGNEARSYDDVYRKWIKTVAMGFDNLYKNIALSGMKNEISTLRSDKFEKVSTAFANLSVSEKEDYELVKEIIDHNLLNYHFQPIVRAEDGSIFSYEALMRSTTRKKLSPLAILKYASMQDRFSEIESATFNNVLNIIERDKDKIGGAKIFINSIPGVKVPDYEEIFRKLEENSDRVVVELTEDAELEDADLEELKGFFLNAGIEIAVDDYGTGYSNISNLLRYMPNYVKIDRSLLSEIHNKPQKQHFVREIIEFCHSNNIKALAEGIETTEELRMVIHLGVDLIQGFYTGRPSEEFVGKISEKVINEIKNYYQERSDGKSKRNYIAGKTNRVSLISLVNDNCSDIVIGREGMVYKDITIVGMPSLKSDIHLRVEPGYSGRITLENVYFSNIKNRPCIEIGENSDVTLIVQGYNVLKNTGIMVPESASLMIEGAGNLKIELNNTEYYGIGNDLASKHGPIKSYMTGRCSISANGTSGIYIGSGLGGIVKLTGGSYDFSGYGIDSVGIGSMFDDCDINISNCGIDMDLSGTRNVGIGSYGNNARVHISESSVKYQSDGLTIVGIGTVKGKNANIKIYNSLAEFCIRADASTGIGALNGKTKMDINVSSVRIENAGENALALGGNSEDTDILLTSVDTRIKLHNKTGKETYAEDKNFKIVNGRCKIMVNDQEIERELVFRFDS